MRPRSPPPSPSLHSFPSPSLSLSPFLLSFRCTSGWPGWLVFPGIANGLGRGEGSKVGSSSPLINPSTSLNCLAPWTMIAILQRCKRRLRQLPPLAQSQAVSKRWGWNPNRVCTMPNSCSQRPSTRMPWVHGAHSSLWPHRLSLQLHFTCPLREFASGAKAWASVTVKTPILPGNPPPRNSIYPTATRG